MVQTESQTLDTDYSKPLLLVYQMGKVASSSIYRAIARQGQFQAFQIHRLNPETIDALVTTFRQRNVELPAHIRDSIEVRQLLDRMESWGHGNIKAIISLVREPVTRNISAFFQNLPLFHDGEVGATIEKAVNDFFENYAHDVPLRWFDDELKPVFGIDVYASEFGFHEKFQTGARGELPYLIMRTEDDINSKISAMQRVLGISELEIRFENVAKKKNYAEMYECFTNSIRNDPRFDGYVMKMHNSKYAQHFYRPWELEEFLLRGGLAK